MARVGVLTVSDSCSSGQGVDKSGPILVKLVEDYKVGKVKETLCVPDNQQEIRKALMNWSDELKLDLIITTGGTGLSPRDVTPEATQSVLHRQAPGLVHSMLAGSLAVTPMAALSRLAAGIRGSTVIVNMPGSHKAVRECFGFIQPVLNHAIDLVQDKKKPVKTLHTSMQSSNSELTAEIPTHTCPHQQYEPAAGGQPGGQGAVGVAARLRQSPYPMISVDEAQKIVIQHCKDMLKEVEGVKMLDIESVPYTAAMGRVLAEDIVAKDPLPPFPASIKDGYAVIASDGVGVRKVRGESSAGYDPSMQPIAPGEIVRINTGAPVPPGADAVVMVENTKLIEATSDGEEVRVEILSNPTPGLDIRPIGSDIQVGECVLRKGCTLGPGELGVLAAVGVTTVKVARLPKVGVLSTGNEIQEPGEDLKPGHIRDSNKTTLKFLIQSKGFHVVDCGIAKDDLSTLKQKLSDSLTECDLLVTTGGVSMGDRDLLRQVLISDFGAQIYFARVNMKPGKPTTFATCTVNGKQKLVLGLPGNPVSATVTCHLYVVPACKALSGQEEPLPGKVRAVLQTSRPIKLDPRPEYQRIWVKFASGESVGSASNTGNQMSSRTTSMAQSNGLMILPGRSQELQEVPAGSNMEFDVILTGDLTTAL
eukprot:TRINITY_DN7082_c1_g1_i15.p1 TRINITY_DN7082_c1_g1~~TRINITY_DN7082_c1_g1_i15.p1  ORF type:complete len:648 (-),score=118.70 TRINITY_DN7082_c1_g1_i15:684-2627(-)